MVFAGTRDALAASPMRTGGGYRVYTQADVFGLRFKLSGKAE
jgi:hypothetical protein